MLQVLLIKVLSALKFDIQTPKILQKCILKQKAFHKTLLDIITTKVIDVVKTMTIVHIVELDFTSQQSLPIKPSPLLAAVTANITTITVSLVN